MGAKLCFAPSSATEFYMDNAARIGLLCLAYMVGLAVSSYSWWSWAIAVLLVSGFYLAEAWYRSRKKRLKFSFAWPWRIGLALVLILASFYGQMRVPHVASQDISIFVNSIEGRGTKQFSTVRGLVDSYPQATRSDRAQFWLQVNQLSQIQGDDPSPASIRKVNGRLYVTAPLISATGLKPGVQVVVTGTLYKPMPVLNPGGLNFENYLARSGSFAGMRANQLFLTDEEQIRTWDLAKIRQRIVAAQVRWLDVPIGPLVSAMALGNEAVDLPFDVKDAFVRVGLAHALAASGFQVSLIVAAIISFTKRYLAKKWQFGLGLVGILAFVAMAGPQPSVLRAAVMGIAVLVGMLLSRQLRPLNSLLLAAVVLLVIEPLWIWDVGFQLSFLATLGLVVSATPIQKKLDFVPPVLAEAIAVPLAATIWTLPIQLWTFKVVPLYSLPANVIAAPFITLISIGGMVSALVAGIFPLAGSAVAWLLLYPTKLLLAIVELFASLPGSNIAVGSIRLWQLLFLYGAIFLVWQLPWWQKRWRLVLALSVLLIAVPLAVVKGQEFKITALAAREERILVIQKNYQTALIDTGDSNTARFTVMPFLTNEAVNGLEQAITLQTSKPKGASIDSGVVTEGTSESLARGAAIDSASKGWQTLHNNLAINKLYHPPQQPLKIPGLNMSPLGKTQDLLGGKSNLLFAEPPLLDLEIGGQHWLIGGDIQIDQQRELAMPDKLQPVQAIYWSGGVLTDTFIKAIRPQVAIAATLTPNPETIQHLEKLGTKVFITGRDGAVQWTAGQGFQALLGSE
jgi:competence protein ComEC